MKIRHRNPAVEGVQLTSAFRSAPRASWPQFIQDAIALDNGAIGSIFPQTPGNLQGPIVVVATDGPQLAQVDDWLIRSMTGELSVMKPDTFAALYERLRTRADLG